VIFQHLMSTWPLRKVFWVSIAWRVLASFVDICLVNRWNITYFGVNDHLWYMFGVNVVAQIAEQIEFMAGVILMSKLCPHSVETTMYAILAGFSNFGGMVAASIGIFLMNTMNIVTTIDSTTNAECDFHNLTLLILIGHSFFLPLLAIPLSFILIPDILATDDLLEVIEETERDKEKNREDERSDQEMMKKSSLELESIY